MLIENVLQCHFSTTTMTFCTWRYQIGKQICSSLEITWTVSAVLGGHGLTKATFASQQSEVFRSSIGYLQCSHLSPTWVLNLLATDECLRSADTDNAPHWHLLHHQHRDFFWIPRTCFEGLGHGRGAWWQHRGIAATTVIGSRSGEQGWRKLRDDCIKSRNINKRIGHSFIIQPRQWTLHWATGNTQLVTLILFGLSCNQNVRTGQISARSFVSKH